MSNIQEDLIQPLDNRFSELSTIENLKESLNNLMLDMGFDNYSYLSIKSPHHLPKENNVCFLNNYPEEWNKRYLCENYYLTDPVATFGNKSRRAFVWGYDSLNGLQTKVFDEAADHGILYGVTVPIHGPDGEIGLFTAVSNTNKQSLLLTANKHLTEIQSTAIETHNFVMETYSDTPRPQDIILTPREKECLTWTTQGKTSWEISKIIFRSTPTVNYHLQKAINKLDSVNKYQAALKAYKLGLLDY